MNARDKGADGALQHDVVHDDDRDGADDAHNGEGNVSSPYLFLCSRRPWQNRKRITAEEILQEFS